MLYQAQGEIGKEQEEQAAAAAAFAASQVQAQQAVALSEGVPQSAPGRSAIIQV